jgi:ribosomal protein S18 acetylase RimI-like enzyme
MPEPVTIDAARPGDAPAIARVHTRSWQHAYRGIFTDTYLDGLDWRARLPFWEGVISAPRPAHVVVVARAGDTLIGFAGAGPARDEDLPGGFGEIYAIYVDPGAWSQGAGSALLDAAIARLAREWAELAALSLWVLEDNHRARRFYASHGFRPDGARLAVERGGISAAEIRYRRPARISQTTEDPS